MRFWKTAFSISLLINIVFAFAWASKRRAEREQAAQLNVAGNLALKSIANLDRGNGELKAMKHQLLDNNERLREQDLRTISALDQLDAYVEEITNNVT